MSDYKSTAGKTAGLSANARALVVTQFVRLLFGAYLAANDWYVYKDGGSAVSVLLIYLFLGIFTVLFLFRKKPGLIGILGLSIILILFHTVFIILAMGNIVDAGLHSPLNNWWETLARYVFFILTMVFGVRVSRETGIRRSAG